MLISLMSDFSTFFDAEKTDIKRKIKCLKWKIKHLKCLTKFGHVI